MNDDTAEGFNNFFDSVVSKWNIPHDEIPLADIDIGQIQGWVEQLILMIIKLLRYLLIKTWISNF